MVPWDECLKVLKHIIESAPRGTTLHCDNIFKVCRTLGIDELDAQEIGSQLEAEDYIKRYSNGDVIVKPQGIQAIHQWSNQHGHNEALHETELTVTRNEYISPDRLAELKALHPADFDLRRLIRLCEEIDVSFRNECWHAVAALTREVLDHVPPIFGQGTFEQVANNYGGGRSFRGSMQHLQRSLRNIADAHLHTQVRKSESLPTATQVNFSNDLDRLLEEIARILR